MGSSHCLYQFCQRSSAKQSVSISGHSLMVNLPLLEEKVKPVLL